MTPRAATSPSLDRWLFPPAPAERLAVLRILVGAYGVGYLLIRLPAFLSLTTGETAQFHPVGVLAPLTRPLPDSAVVALVAAALTLGVAFTLGVRFRWTGPAFALSLLALSTYRSSWGQIIWLEALVVLHTLIVGFSPSADALAVARQRPASAPPPSAAYGGPVRLAALVLVATYVLAGVAKLRGGGIGWIVGDSLRNHVAATAVRADLLGSPSSPLGSWLVQFGWLFPPMALASVLLELSAPVALMGGRIRTVWVLAAWLMHVNIAALMFITFPYPLSVVAFAPLYRLERLPPALASLWCRLRRLTAR